MSIVRDHQMLVSWRSTDAEAKHVAEFVKVVINATMEGLLQRERDLSATERAEASGS